MLVLAGDIGGTKTRLGLFEADGGRLTPGAERTYSSAAYATFDELVAGFVAETGARCDGAGLGIAGPVAGRRVHTTNLPWLIDADDLERRLAIPSVRLLNDLEATAWGLDELAPEDLAVLQEGDRTAQGNRAVIAAGTGLGEAGLFWEGGRFRPFATEGGHASFSPADALELDFLRFLSERHGHVSWERVLSGPGLVNVFQFMLVHGGETVPEWLGVALSERDAAAVIVEAARRQGHPACVAAVELFVRLYGSEAGNLALHHLATGGVFVAGGIAPKILDFLSAPSFRTAFSAKGRLQGLLERIRVTVVLNERTALLGAARAATSEAAAS
jgi:glucokinase